MEHALARLARLTERRWTKKPDEEVQPSKTVWDFLQLLIVPAMLAHVGFEPVGAVPTSWSSGGPGRNRPDSPSTSRRND